MRLARDTWLLFAYNLRTTLRNPAWLLIGLFQPILWLLLFAPLLDGIAQTPGFPPGGVLNMFAPGILLSLGLYSSLFVGFGLIAELRAGVLERLAVTPASRLALVLGRVLRDVVVLVAQSILLLAAAWAMGLRASVSGVTVVLGLMILIGLLTASCSYALALRNEDALASALTSATQPLFLLSGIVLPLALAPWWIQALAALNPFFHAVEGARVLFIDTTFDIDTTCDASVVRAFAIVGILATLSLAWAARSFRRLVA